MNSSNLYFVAYFLAQARQERKSLEKRLRESRVNKRENYKVISSCKMLLIFVLETALFLALSWPGTHYTVEVCLELITPNMPDSPKCGT